MYPGIKEYMNQIKLNLEKMGMLKLFLEEKLISKTIIVKIL